MQPPDVQQRAALQVSSVKFQNWQKSESIWCSQVQLGADLHRGALHSNVARRVTVMYDHSGIRIISTLPRPSLTTNRSLR